MANFALKLLQMEHFISFTAYYYQVQTQLFESNLDYCDFCVCTFADGEAGLHIQRIHKDQPFWDVVSLKQMF